MEIRFLELNSVCCPERSFDVAGKSWDDGVVKMNTIFKEEIRVSKIAVFCYKEILATFNILVNQFVCFLNSSIYCIHPWSDFADYDLYSWE